MAGRKKDYSEAQKLYEAGLSIGEVATFFGVSRQAMWDALRRRGTKMRPQLRYGQENHFFRGGVLASDKTQNVLEKAVMRGIVKRAVRCQVCGDAPTMRDGRTAIQAHHADYNKPLDVAWLCQKCHHEWHKHNRPIPRERR